MNESFEVINKVCAKLGIKPTKHCLLVCISTQKMHFFKSGKWAHTYTISTSLRPPSNIKDSFGTPRGLHEIAERIGAGEPSGMVFKARRPTGQLFSEIESTTANADAATISSNAALVTTRILWLRGLEFGVNRGDNVDTHERYIYIHGTNRESFIGQPQSSGCVLMRNHEIIDLFDQISVGDTVLITD